MMPAWDDQAAILDLLNVTLRATTTSLLARHDALHEHYPGTGQDQAARDLLERLHRLRGAIKRYQATLDDDNADRIEEDLCF